MSVESVEALRGLLLVEKLDQSARQFVKVGKSWSTTSGDCVAFTDLDMLALARKSGLKYFSRIRIFVIVVLSVFCP